MPLPLRIVHAIDRRDLTSGASVQMLEAAVELGRRGHLVVVAAPGGGDVEAACARRQLPFVAAPYRHELDLRSVLMLRTRLREAQIVHVHKGRAHTVVLGAAAGLGRWPAVVVNRGVSFPLTMLNRWKYRHPRVGAVVCVADAVRRVVIASAGVPPERVHTIYGGTDPLRFDPARADGRRIRRELGLGDGELLVGQVSTRDWKGWRDLLAAFSLVRRERTAVKLLLVGCEPVERRRQVAAAAAERGLADAVLTLGFRRDMPDLLAACDVVVDASWAGTGITGTVREAMVLARPVVVTDCGGNRELVVDSRVGSVTPRRDPTAMALALGRLLADEELRTKLGRAGRGRVLEGFTTSHRVDRLESLYHTLVPQAPADKASGTA